MKRQVNRRRFLVQASAAAAAAGLPLRRVAAAEEKPALLGGKPVRAKKPFASWPQIAELDEQEVMDTLRTKRWFRGSGEKVGKFEEAYAKLTGAKHCVAVANGTSALVVSLGALDIGPGDEVIVPPYTFIATVNAVLMHHALPVFVDSDLETFQIDPSKIESAITERTAAILPVHIGGYAADLDRILGIGQRRKLPVVEDACQAHLGEWKGKKLGTLGTTGCFSFQISKNLSSGEGGAVLTNDAALATRCYAFHNNGRGKKFGGYNFTYVNTRAANYRMTEFQGGLLLAQMTRIEKQADTREENGKYLTRLLQEIPGISPARRYEGCTRSAYHLYMFRFDPAHFAGLTRAKFMAALSAEGVGCSSGYGRLNREPFLKEVLKSRGYQRSYPKEVLAAWEERTACPQNDKLCDQAVWFTQNMLLGPRSDMDEIAAAVRKIQAHAGALAKKA